MFDLHTSWLEYTFTTCILRDRIHHSIPSYAQRLLSTHSQVHQRVQAAAQASIEMDRIWDERDGWNVFEPTATEVARADFTYGACIGCFGSILCLND